MSDSRIRKYAVVVGAGPAGLTAALELLRRSDVTPIVFETDEQVGGISKTVNYRGNRMDLGGHRFFSKSDWVMRWWQEILPVALEASDPADAVRITYQQQSREVRLAQGTYASSDSVMFVRQRLSRIFYRRRFFDYPLQINANTLRNLGLRETLHIGASYGAAQLLRRAPEKSLEDFLVNRFGKRLYRTFFKEYTEKVWGVPCGLISAEWGAQRIKGLSVTKAVADAMTRRFRTRADTAQKQTETSLIERFLYPKFGPGRMWEKVASMVEAGGGTIRLRHRVVGIEHQNAEITAVSVRDELSRAVTRVPCDHFISTMPVRDLVRCLAPDDRNVKAIADRLPYRDFITAGLLVRRMNAAPGARAAGLPANGMPPDNWIYIQEPHVRVGRMQIFNNWSPAMVADPNTIWLGLEYFCTEGDDLWVMDDARFLNFAADELARMGMVQRNDVLDGTVVRVAKAYPAYFGSYGDFSQVRAYLDGFKNLYPVGRNGMHRYNNQDHSMLTAKSAVDSITNHGAGKSAIWGINEEDDYHEERKGSAID